MPKKLLSMRLDQDIADWFKAQGRGDQTKKNELLRVCGQHQTATKKAAK